MMQMGLYKLHGMITKTKTHEDIYVLAKSESEAIASAQTFAKDVKVISHQTVSKHW